MRDDSNVIHFWRYRSNNCSAPSIAWLLGGAGVLAFSLSLTANKVAVAGIDAVGITVWRAVIAGTLAAIYLVTVRAPLPGRSSAGRLLVSGMGVIVGFPLLSSLALQSIDSGRAAIILGLLPAFTAMFGQLIAGERLPWGFWAAALAGIAVLTIFLLATTASATPLRLGWGDLQMLGATLCSALGYALGAREAREMGGAQSISWSLVLLLPAALVAALLTLPRAHYELSLSVVTAMAYIAVVSQLLGFFAWYGGLARGGIARVGQIQQLQPMLTIAASAFLLHEPLTTATWFVGAVIAALVWVAQRIRTQPSSPRLEALPNFSK
ncbi:DMT family transporter [Mycobacterium sp. 852013-50091_SCH5140682]|uniref:DMT family transporter n=1 Tax=Mycobacterium sp. 852013-50091_SCH5140682 TaxID=1834109 RepID=UPI0009ECCEC3|nr:DMT family transporter [Mycobacterium sp. 852013-50091_SCH5140682]